MLKPPSVFVTFLDSYWLFVAAYFIWPIWPVLTVVQGDIRQTRVLLLQFIPFGLALWPSAHLLFLVLKPFLQS